MSPGGSPGRPAIRRLFHVPVDFFCYPAGRYDARVIAAVRRAGFLGATTTNWGLARPSQPYTLDRVRVSGGNGERGQSALNSQAQHPATTNRHELSLATMRQSPRHQSIRTSRS